MILKSVILTLMFNVGAFAADGKPTPQDQYHQALAQLSQQQQVELAPIYEKIKALQEKNLASRKSGSNVRPRTPPTQDGAGALMDQAQEIRDKYELKRFALYDTIHPGAGARMAQNYQRQTDFRKQLQTLEKNEGAELSALPQTAKLSDKKAVHEKYAAQQKALRASFLQQQRAAAAASKSK
jgi:hypothetical protein